MARTPEVTRTIITTKALLMCANTENESIEKREAVLPRTYKDDKAVLKAARNVIETDTIKVISVVSTETEETLYGMTEQEFIDHARVLPPRKVYTKDNDTDDTNAEQK